MAISIQPADFIGALRIPVASFPSVAIAVLLLFVANATWTLPIATSASGRVIRLILAAPALYYFYDFAYGDYGVRGRLTNTGMCVVGLYGMMQTIQCALVGLQDREPPCWVSIRSGQKKTMPTGLFERAVYAVDLSTSLRGTSWLPDTNWDWIAKTTFDQQKAMNLTRWQFVRCSLATFVTQYFIVDAFDTLNKSRPWDTRLMHPITSLPWYEQLPFTISVCVGTMTAIVVEFSFLAAIFVACGAPAEGWPPMFNSPFSATSLADLWTIRWHSIFRRSFERLSLLILWIVPDSAGRLVRRLLRVLAIFWLSAGLHILLMHRLETNDEFVHPSFWDRSTLKFFLLQPLCLTIEWVAIAPLSRRLLPPRWQTVPTRLWAWGSLLFTGRYWSDVWVRRGMWGPSEKVVGFSVVRGVWKDQWFL
ncbi:hypothetical protein AURDEDRAFT_111938 [Auricularia subglabra TFB-10046 SS5]|nr:hypothetical protein AURDEDRAFT_111938 [Auricularia subglabra TFB-10046 SS5]